MSGLEQRQHDAQAPADVPGRALGVTAEHGLARVEAQVLEAPAMTHHRGNRDHPEPRPQAAHRLTAHPAKKRLEPFDGFEGASRQAVARRHRRLGQREGDAAITERQEPRGR